MKKKETVQPKIIEKNKFQLDGEHNERNSNVFQNEIKDLKKKIRKEEFISEMNKEQE